MPLNFIDYRHQTQFQRNLWGDEFAHHISRITIGWGNIEFWLFQVLQAIDYKRAEHWAAQLFVSPVLEKRKEVVRKQITASLLPARENYLDELNIELDILSSIQTRRNLIAHGFWHESKDGKTFKVQPLRIAKGKTTLEDAVNVDLDFLSDLVNDMNRVVNGFAGLSSGIMAYGQLKKWGKA